MYIYIYVSVWMCVGVVIIIKSNEFANFSKDIILCKYGLNVGYKEMRYKYDHC